MKHHDTFPPTTLTNSSAHSVFHSTQLRDLSAILKLCYHRNNGSTPLIGFNESFRLASNPSISKGCNIPVDGALLEATDPRRSLPVFASASAAAMFAFNIPVRVLAKGAAD